MIEIIKWRRAGKALTAAQIDILPGGIIHPIGEGSNVLTMPTRSR